MNFASLRLRMALAGMAMVVLVTAGAWLGLSVLFERHVERWAVTELRSQIDLIVSDLIVDPNGKIHLSQEPSDPRYSEPFSGRYWQVSHGTDRLRSPSLWGEDLSLTAVPIEIFGDLVVEQAKGPISEQLLIAHRSLSLWGSTKDEGLIVSVARERSSLAVQRKEFLADLLPYFAIFSFALLVAGAIQFFVGLSPLSRISARVLALTKGEAQRIGNDLPVEVRPLAVEIDRLLSERDTQIVKARKRAAELAHVFKTPLQALMGEAHRLRNSGNSAAAEGVEEIAATMQAHVERELHSARQASRSIETAEPVQIVDSLIGVLRRIPSYAKLIWTVSRQSRAHASADPSALTEALGAILENAARFAVSEVNVTISDDPDGRLRITVRDDGPGIERVSENDNTANEENNRAGIGLTIAADVAHASGGYLELSKAASGFKATIVFGSSSEKAQLG
jgi:signal transduction histidine kinase